MSDATQPVIDAIVENRKRFEAFCYSLSADELNRPVPESTWMVRDFAAHLGSLDPAMAALFGSAIQGEQAEIPTGGASFDVDAFNDAAIAERRTWPLAQVFEEAAKNRALLIDVISALEQQHIDKPMKFAGDAKRKAGVLPLKLFLAGWAQHDPIHVADMLRALPERAEDPPIRAWLDNPFIIGYQRAMNPA